MIERKVIAGALASLALLSSGDLAWAAGARTGRLDLITARQSVTVEVTVAATPEEWIAPFERAKSPDGELGVLLLRAREGFYPFTAKGAAGPVDAIAIDAGGHVAWIREGMQADRVDAAPVPVLAVLFVRAGFVARFEVARGNLIRAQGFSIGPVDRRRPADRDRAVATRALSAFVRANPRDVEARLSLARLRLGAGELAQATRELERVNRIALSGEAYAGLGAIAAASGQTDVARRHLERALELDPGFETALERLAALLERDGLVEEALSLLARKAGGEADGQSARLSLARAHLARNALDEAEAALAPLLPDARYRPDAMRILGDIRLRRGQAREAATAYVEYLTAYPSAPHAAELRAFIAVHRAAAGTKPAGGSGEKR